MVSKRQGSCISYRSWAPTAWVPAKLNLSVLYEMYKRYSNSYWNSCEWIISYSKHHLESPDQNILVILQVLGTANTEIDIPRLAQSAALQILQNYPEKEERRGKSDKVAGKAAPFLCLHFRLLYNSLVAWKLESDSRYVTSPQTPHKQSDFSENLATLLHT